MKGKIQVEVSNRDVKFKFTLNRNITVIRGESGTGKTTLFEMIAEYTRLGNKSGVNVRCKKKRCSPDLCRLAKTARRLHRQHHIHR